MSKVDRIYSGKWWFPGEDDFKAGGRFELGDKFILETSEPLGRKRYPRGTETFSDAVILGRSLDDRLSLFDCHYQGGTTTDDPEEGHLRVFSQTVLIGDRHIERKEDLLFTEVTFRLTHLNEWSGRQPYLLHRNPKRITLNDQPDLLAVVPGAQISLCRRRTESYHRLTGATWESHEAIRIKLEAATRLDVIEANYMKPLAYLLTLASGGWAQEADVRVYDNKDESSGMANGFDVLHAGKSALVDFDPIYGYNMRFTLVDAWPCSIAFGEAVARWFDVYSRFGPACDMIFAGHRSDSQYLQTKFFVAASAVEGLYAGLHPDSNKPTLAHSDKITSILSTTPLEHREWLSRALADSHRKSFKTQLVTLAEYAGPALLSRVGALNRWASTVTRARNSVAHAHRDVMSDPIKWLRLYESTQMLGELVLLRQMGFSSEQCANMASRETYWSGMKERIQRDIPNLFR